MQFAIGLCYKYSIASGSLSVDYSFLLCYYLFIESRKKAGGKVTLIMKSETKRRADVFLSILLSTVLFAFSCAFIAVLTLRTENAGTIIRNMDISGIFYETDISYYIVHQLNGLPFNEAEITFSDIEEFIKTDAASREVGNVVYRYIRAYAEGNLDYYLSAGEIYVISRNLEPELYDLFNHHMTDADFRNLANTLVDIMDFRGMSVGNIVYDYGIDINTAIPFLLISPYLLWGTAILCLIAILFIFFVQSKKIAYAFLFTGIPLALSGLLVLTAGILLGYFPALLGDTLYSISGFTWGLALLVIRNGIILAAVGILFMAAYIIVKRRLSSF